MDYYKFDIGKYVQATNYSVPIYGIVLMYFII